MLELHAQLSRLPAHIRDARAEPAPPDIEERRLQVYRELFFNNLESLFSGNFPVLKRILGGEAWQALIRDFLRAHQASTPLFPEIAREMLKYLESRRETHGDPEWYLELAHYEWAELALDIAEATHPGISDATADFERCRLHLSPLAWPLAYRWPVHRLSPDFLPSQVPPQPTLLLVRRDPDLQVRFSELSPLSFRLLQGVTEREDATANEQLRALAQEAGVAENDAAFQAEGERMLREFIKQGVLIPHLI